MATTKVTRLDHYPKENPMGWAVGFTVETSNGRSFYRDTVIPYGDASNDNLAIDLAYGKLQVKINNLIESYEKQGTRLGSEYVVRTYTPPPAVQTIITETPVEEATTEEEETPVEEATTEEETTTEEEATTE